MIMMSGCTTMTYTSQRPAQDVADCIAKGWRKVPDSRIEPPVTLTKEEDFYFVDVVLVRDFPTFIAIHSIWAKVRPSSSAPEAGSTTEYRRNFQITHKKIDAVVETCQEGVETPPMPDNSSKSEVRLLAWMT